MSDWITYGGLLGGIGLFLLGMSLMTDGLKLAAGPALGRILTYSTKTRIRGLASGALLTALVQSSSAVTVAAIGFVNAGLLTLGQSLWVLFGANVGTTMTGWLVALVGLQFKIELLALPLIGLGLVCAGAMGNLWDRFLYGGVRDFILFTSPLLEPFFPGGHWPTFNLADAWIVAGIPLIAIGDWIRAGREAKEAEAGKAGGAKA